MNERPAAAKPLRWATFAITLAIVFAVAMITLPRSERCETARPQTAGRAENVPVVDGRAVSMPTYPVAVQFDLRTVNEASGHSRAVQLCQFVEPAFSGVDSADCPSQAGEPLWHDWRPIPWQVFAQGEYVGPHRTVHVPEYRFRADDELEFVYLFTHDESSEAYRFGVGDELVIESLTDETLNRGDLNLGRGLKIQPDGTVTLRLLGQASVAGHTVEEIREELEQRYLEFYIVPAITVTPLKTKTKLEDLKAAIDARYGTGGLVRSARVTPQGTVQLPGIGDVPANGLTAAELEREVEERYLECVGQGVQVTPVLVQRAPRFIFVLGEVATPGRFTLEGPTTAMQAIALAGSWNNGGNLREVVVFRRAEDWRLMATKLDLYGALLARRPCPADEIWLRDSDIVVVPKSPILLVDDFIELVFTRGIYGIVPFPGISINVQRLSTL
ncbi:MAG: polysaccharide biosynthesis/export family protein [Pirellulaceae bacterium]